MIIRWPVPNNLGQPKALLNRLNNSAVVWQWCFNGLRLGFGLFLLPLVLHKLSKADLGMYYVFLALTQLVPVIDFGFGGTIGRFVSYAVGGAETLQAQGVGMPATSSEPNYSLLWQLLQATRTLYRYLSLVVFVVLGLWGTYTVELPIHETSSVLITRLAWGATLASTLADIYTGWWLVYLRGLNEVVTAARIGVLAIAVKFVIAAALLLGGGGLLSIPLATLVSSLLQRQLARRLCLGWLKGQPRHNPHVFRETLRLLWPNTWRLGVQFMSSYLTLNANINICSHAFGLKANAVYGLSIQLMNIAIGMASVWTLTKWPLIGQYQARHEYAALRAVFRPRVWLQTFTYLLLAGAVVLLGPALLQHFGSGKEMLPLPWLLVLALYMFFEMQFSLWGTLIFMGNRLNYLWPTVATNILSLILSLALVHFTTLGLGALVLGPLLAGIIFNYWYWPPFAARGIGTTLFRFLFFSSASYKQANAPE
jgi:Na+-driven multidrug efflux pump